MRPDLLEVLREPGTYSELRLEPTKTDNSEVMEGELVKPGGKFSSTIYGRRWHTKAYSKYLVRPITNRIPKSWLRRAVSMVMPVAFPLTDVLFRLPMRLRKAFTFAIPVANYVDKSSFTREQRYQEAVLDTSEMLSLTYDQPMSVEELKSALAVSGLEPSDYRRRRSGM